jgi:hypothetical protein
MHQSRKDGDNLLVGEVYNPMLAARAVKYHKRGHRILLPCDDVALPPELLAYSAEEAGVLDAARDVDPDTFAVSGGSTMTNAHRDWVAPLLSISCLLLLWRL